MSGDFPGGPVAKTPGSHTAGGPKLKQNQVNHSIPLKSFDGFPLSVNQPLYEHLRDAPLCGFNLPLTYTLILLPSLSPFKHGELLT